MVEVAVLSSPAVSVIHNIQRETDQKLRTVQIQPDKQFEAFTTVPSFSSTALISGDSLSTTKTSVTACYSSTFPHKTLQSTRNSSNKTSSTSSSPAGALGNNASTRTHNRININTTSNRHHHEKSGPSNIHINFNNLLWKAKRRRNENCNSQESLSSSSASTPSSFLIKLNKPITNNNRSKKAHSESPRIKNKVEGENSSARRIFTAEFKQSVVDAFTHDAECVGNQRATARKFRIHRRQVQKWIQQRSVPTPSPTIKVNSPNETRKGKGNKLLVNSDSESPNLNSIHEPNMSNAINALLSLREGVRVNPPWSPQNPTLSPSMATMNLGALGNLGILSQSASMLQDMDSSPPLPHCSTSNGHTKLNKSIPRNYRLRSPRVSPQSATSSSPPNRNHNQNHHRNQSSGSNHHSSHTYPNLTNGNNLNDIEHLSPSEIIDELSFLYPQEDFTLLRKACLKNEITLTKLANRLSYGAYQPTLTPSPSASASRPSSNGNGNSGNNNEYLANHSLQEILKQAQYAQFIQQYPFPVFPSDMSSTNPLNFSSLADPSSSKYPSWMFISQAMAAANATATATANANLTRSGINGTGKKKPSPDQHMFLSPKTPVSSNKPKTVAAALAASRHSPNIMGTIVGNGKSSGKKPAVTRKKRQGKTSTITRPPTNLTEADDDIDPMSMLEITTNPPPEYGGMDLTTTASYSFNGNDSISTTAATNSRRRSKLSTPSPYSNSVHSHLLAPPQVNSPTPSPTNLTNFHSSSKQNGHNALSAASHSMEDFFKKILPHSKSPPSNLHSKLMMLNSSSTAGPNADQLKMLEALIDNSEESDESPGFSGKLNENYGGFGKLPDIPSKSHSILTKPINGGVNLTLDANLEYSKFSNNLPSCTKLAQLNEDNISNGDGDSHHSGSSKSTGSVSSANVNLELQKTSVRNKRKNKKPNQICDFQNDDLPDDSEALPLDMVVPIKKRRVSNSNNSS